MTNDILIQIRARCNAFTRAEKKVADYVLADPRKVLYLSITDLAEACSVGDTSVFRFCRDLGLKGYQEFKMAVAQSISVDDEIAEPVRLESDDDTFPDMVRKMLIANMSSLKETSELISEEQIGQAVAWMIAAERILFFGVGASMITAMSGYNRFMRIVPKVSIIPDSHMQAMAAALMGERDLAIIVSYAGSTRDTADIARIARSRGAKVICITRFVKSPLTGYSDLTLLCGSNEGPYQGGSLSAMIAQMFLLDVLYMAYYRQTREQSKTNRTLTTDSIADKLY